MNIHELRKRQSEAHESAVAITNQAEADKRDLTDDEIKEVEGLNAEFDRLDKQIQQLDRIANNGMRLNEGQGRQTDADLPGRNPDDHDPEPAPQNSGASKVVTRRQSVTPPTRIDFVDRNGGGKWGWRNFGEFCREVKNASQQGARIDPRFTNAPSTYGSEGVGADGGFAVPPDFRAAIMEKVMGEESLLARTDLQTTSSNTFTIPTDNTTPWQTSGGIQAYWDSEAAQMTQSKPNLAETSIKLHKLSVLVPVTDELLEDAPGLDGYLRRKAPEKINFKVSKALVSGTGAGQPLGVLNSDCTVSVSKETGQGADTLQYENVLKMWSRMYAPLRSGAVWLVHQDIEPALHSMVMNIGTGGVPVYMPPGGVSQSPYGSLFGRPVVPHQACETLGDKGDIILGNWSHYLAVQKAGGIRSDVSIHLWFDYNVTAYRFVLRIGGQPWWNDTIDQADGSNTLGCFVTLAERA